MRCSLDVTPPSFHVNYGHIHSAYHSSTGMHTSKSLTTFRRSVYTLQMPTVDMHGHFSRTSKQHGRVRSSILFTQERLSRLRRRSRLPRKSNVSIISPPSRNETFFLISHLFSFHAETCQRCGYMSSNALCKACTLLEGLERGMADSGIVSYFHPIAIISTLAS